MNTLKEEAIDEIMIILQDMNEIKDFVGKYGIIWHSDCWVAVYPHHNHKYEDIFNWNKEKFQDIDVTDIHHFNLGGSISTCEWKLFGKYECTSKELEQAKANFVTSLLSKKVYYTKYFDLEFFDEELEENCGWEHFMGIKAIIKPNAIQSNTEIRTKKLLEEIKNEGDSIIELSASPVYEQPKNEFSKESGLQPQGEFAYMVEFFSWSLIDPSESQYQGCFSQHDYNGKYIRDCMKLINKVEKRAKELADKYADKGVKVTVNDFNEGCQYGMAVYVWIPYQ